VQQTDFNAFQPARNQYLDPLVQSFLSFGSELNPALGSYYTNVSAIFRGDVSFHNLTSISEDQDDTWHPLAYNFMNGTNITSIPQHLGTWNWTNTGKIGIKIHDRKVTGAVDATEDIAIFHVGNSKSIQTSLIRSNYRARSNCSIQTYQIL
jgi:hypothetical protein